MSDYEQYAAVWSCQRILFGHRESAQIMSRKPTLSRDVITKIRKRFETFGINEHYFSVIDQSKCGWDEVGKRTAGSGSLDANHSNRTFSFRLGPLQIANRR